MPPRVRKPLEPADYIEQLDKLRRAHIENTGKVPDVLSITQLTASAIGRDKLAAWSLKYGVELDIR